MYTLQFGKQTTLASVMTIGEVTSATLASAGFTDFTADYLVIDYDVPSKREVIKCNVTGTAISAITRGQEGTSAVQHEAGAKVGYNFIPTHYADVAANGVLGYAEVTADQSTINGDLTNLTSTVTVPAGGRRVRIKGFANFNADGAWAGEFKILEGATVLGTSFVYIPTAGTNMGFHTEIIITPTAGSHTYKLALTKDGANNANLGASATLPAFISVEYLGGV